MRLFRTSIAAAVIALAMVPGLLPATAGAATAPYAAMAIDANTGAVLHNDAGDARRFPASLTKMMTLYLTFELIEKGRLSYGSKIPVTAEAAGASPSKLGLKPGAEISVIDAIKALVTKSANDVAIALAQRIGGTEPNFAQLMTRRARELGMKSTTFKNASGLPDPDQVTTARDMLTLALRLQDDFPTHYKLFATRTFAYAGHTYRNHNELLGRYHGIDGIKTGYTRASGFNLVSSVRRDGKHVVAVVFGGKTARVRNARMRALLDKALAKASTKVTRKPALVAAAPERTPAPKVRAAAPPVRATLPARTASASAASAAVRPPAPVAVAERGSAISVARVRPILIGPGMKTPTPAATGALAERPQPAFAAAGAAAGALPRFAPENQLLGAARGPGAPPSTLQAQAEALALSGAGPRVATLAPQPGTGALLRQAAPGPQGAYAIQIGAYGSVADAEQQMEAARRRASGMLDPYPGVAVPVQKGSSEFFRARFRGFEQTAAASACAELKRLKFDCFVVGME